MEKYSATVTAAFSLPKSELSARAGEISNLPVRSGQGCSIKGAAGYLHKTVCLISSNASFCFWWRSDLTPYCFTLFGVRYPS